MDHQRVTGAKRNATDLGGLALLGLHMAHGFLASVDRQHRQAVVLAQGQFARGLADGLAIGRDHDLGDARLGGGKFLGEDVQRGVDDQPVVIGQFLNVSALPHDCQPARVVISVCTSGDTQRWPL